MTETSQQLPGFGLPLSGPGDCGDYFQKEARPTPRNADESQDQSAGQGGALPSPGRDGGGFACGPGG